MNDASRFSNPVVRGSRGLALTVDFGFIAAVDATAVALAHFVFFPPALCLATTSLLNCVPSDSQPIINAIAAAALIPGYVTYSLLAFRLTGRTLGMKLLDVPAGGEGEERIGWHQALALGTGETLRVLFVASRRVARAAVVLVPGRVEIDSEASDSPGA